MAIAVAPPAGARKVPVIAAPGIKMVFAEVTFTGAYVLGGEALDPKAFGLKRIVAVSAPSPRRPARPPCGTSTGTPPTAS
jgi:hypothetical protein